MVNVVEDQKQFFEYVNNSIIKNNKLSHAYLIETNEYENYELVVKEFIKKILTLDINDDSLKQKIELQVDCNDYPDITYIYPDGLYIKKEQLLMLESQYFKKSMLDNKLIYVIYKSEQLNDSSANTILKFLEEPPENVIAILVASNKYNVLETIVSRCQRLSLINSKSENFSEIIEEFCKDLNNPKNIFIKYDYYLENLFLDKNIARDNLKQIEEYLFLSLKDQKEDIEKLSDKIKQIEEEMEILKYNVNMKIWFSSFIFKMMEVII